jgi:hypothetical protein
MLNPSAVITADIVNYTRLSRADEKKLISILSSLLSEHKFEFYRGDSFQVYVKEAEDALKLTLQIRAAAKKFMQKSAMPVTDVRASIGIGQVNTPVRTLRTASGEAFIISGRNFDEMRRPDQRLVIQSAVPVINPGLNVTAHFVDFIFRQLTSKQAEVVFELLKDKTQAEIAKRLKKSQATINQHAQSAGWNEIDKILEEYRQLTGQLQLLCKTQESG